MKLFNGEYQVPVLAPYNITILYLELAEMLFVKIFVVLGMGMTTDKVADVYRLRCVVAEVECHRQSTCIQCVSNIQPSHLYMSSNML